MSLSGLTLRAWQRERIGLRTHGDRAECAGQSPALPSLPDVYPNLPGFAGPEAQPGRQKSRQRTSGTRECLPVCSNVNQGGQKGGVWRTRAHVSTETGPADYSSIPSPVPRSPPQEGGLCGRCPASPRFYLGHLGVGSWRRPPTDPLNPHYIHSLIYFSPSANSANLNFSSLIKYLPCELPVC